MYEGPKFFLRDGSVYRSVRDYFGHKVSGVYRLHVCETDDTLVALPRLLGTDLQGVIYIGESEDLPLRAGNLQISISTAYDRVKWDSRDGAVETRFTKRFQKRFAYDQLCITVRPLIEVDGQSEFKSTGHMVRHMLDQCLADFGELPPLNSF